MVRSIHSKAASKLLCSPLLAPIAAEPEAAHVETMKQSRMPEGLQEMTCNVINLKVACAWQNHSMGQFQLTLGELH